MSFQFKPFKEDWLTHTDILNSYAKEIEYSMNLDSEFFSSLRFDSISLKQYRINAAKSAASNLGNNPVLCFSGGADSQAMIQAWEEAGLSFDVAILRFNDNLNQQDISTAVQFCETKKIEPVYIDLDVVKFLTRESIDFADQYKCTSPHFVTHYKMFDKLRELGYSGICCGGTAFAKGMNDWGPTPSAAQANYIEYVRQNQYPVIGNFLGHDPALCWSIALLTPEVDVAWNSPSFRSMEEINTVRYLAKVEGYRKHGFFIIQQENKFTGFELVKDYFAEKHNDGWSFEKLFRIPLQKKYGTASGILKLTTEQEEQLSIIYSKNFPSSNTASS